MLKKLTIRNFKRFQETELDLGERVVFVGPNNSGKTSAMQALALWEMGVKWWRSKLARNGTSSKHTGATINRLDFLAAPHPVADLLWRGRRTKESSKIEGKQKTGNIRIDIVVEGISDGRAWQCGMEFDYANSESFYCRPLRLGNGGRMPVPDEATNINIGFLPPMSGLAATEFRLEMGAINVRLGEGRTAEVLRNLCWRLFETAPEQWKAIVERINALFGVTLNSPKYIPSRGEVRMDYVERGIEFDLASSGRGLQQTLLILTYLHANPNTVILLDEPNAHLETLRQSQIFNLVSEIASDSGSQIIAASHSQTFTREAANSGAVISSVG